MIVEIITPMLVSGHSNLYIWLAQTTNYLIVSPLNDSVTLPTALEWKSGTVPVGRLIPLIV
jgi:hypothetical protein